MSAEGGRLFDINYALRDHQGKARSSHPDTSKQAARLIAPKAGTKRMQVLREIALFDPQGVTDEGICLALGMNPSTERPRRVELVEAGWVEDSGERLLLRSGTHAILWRLTQRGREAL